ncbi:MAG: sensor histidine kinase [Polymorphobacter sp.]
MIPELDFEALFREAPTPLMVLDTEFRFVAANNCYLGVTGRTWSDLDGQFVFDAFPDTPERQENIMRAFVLALAGEGNTLKNNVFAIDRPKDGFQDVWWTCEQLPVRNATGAIIGVMQHSRDVSNEVAAERMRDAISKEYDHRVRNILTKVSAIARRTAAHSGSTQAFIADFDPRISSMARAHQLLVEGGWERMSLSELVASEMEPYATPEILGHHAIDFGGPVVALSSRVAQALGMALHELATNAVKYGALSRPGGQLHVNWSVNASTGAVLFRWTETGVRGLGTPSPSGFGSTIIDRILPAEIAGTVARDFTPDGLVCTIEIPVPTKP